ncbi:hypothetical protein CRG98_028623 [Punica granatum]|uniref:RanBD1 domain-containing protein n=1 Tax=Punica granatum TaxID=22663 RepID=A0A2I0J5J2_PUNGR|nr:hypothetical protein CRG98_028623 [Punica granatum]
MSTLLSPFSATAAAAAQPSKNPFAGIRLVPPPEPALTQEGQATAIETKGSEQSESETKESENEAAARKDEGAVEKIEVSKAQEPQTESAVEKVEEGRENERAESGSKETKVESAAEKVEVGKEAEQDTEIEAAQAESAPEKNAADESENDDLNEAPKTETEDKAESEVKKDEENSDSASGGTSFSSFQQLSSTKNAFTGLAGTGFSGSAFSFGSIAKDGSASPFGPKPDQPSFSFGLTGNGSSSVFGSSGAPIIPKAEGSGFPSKEEIVIETGEENEKVVFSADSVLFEFTDGNWKERGKGEIKVNVSSTGTEKARLVMRTKGNLRLVMNASLYPEIKLTNMDKKGITFACMNSISEGKTSLSTFALKFKDGTFVEMAVWDYPSTEFGPTLGIYGIRLLYTTGLIGSSPL